MLLSSTPWFSDTLRQNGDLGSTHQGRSLSWGVWTCSPPRSPDPAWLLLDSRVVDVRLLPISERDLPEGICYTRGPKEKRSPSARRGGGVAGKLGFGPTHSVEQSS